MNRARAEELGWVFELDDEPGAFSYARRTSIAVDRDKVIHQDEQAIATSSDQPEQTLLANIAELEGEPFADGYGVEPAEPPEPPPTPAEQVMEKLAQMPGEEPITAAMLADLLGTLSG